MITGAPPAGDGVTPSLTAYSASQEVAAKTPGWLITQIVRDPAQVANPYDGPTPHDVALACARVGRWADAAKAHADAASVSESVARQARNAMVPLSDEVVREHDRAAQFHRLAERHCRSMCS